MCDLTPFEMWFLKMWYNLESVRMHDLTPFEMWILKIWYNSVIQCACAIWHPFESWILKIWYNSVIQCACAIWHPSKCEFWKSDIILWFSAHARSDTLRNVNFENLISFCASVNMRDLTPFEMWILKIWYNSVIQCECAIWHPSKCEFWNSDIFLWFSAHARSDTLRNLNFENL